MTVRQGGGGHYSSISAAVAAVPSTLSNDYCIVVDSATYYEQVTVQKITANQYRLSIVRDWNMSSSLAPTIVPPASSTAAFQVMNASVSIIGFNIAPNLSLPYGVRASSAMVDISSVNVNDNSGHISQAGIWITSATSVSASSVTVQNARGLYATGSYLDISRSSFSAASPWPALHFFGVAYSSVTQVWVKNTSGVGLQLGNGSLFNTIRMSRFEGNVSGAAVYLNNAAFNEIKDSEIINIWSHALYLNGSGTTNNTIRQSSMTSMASSSYAAYIYSQAAGNTITQSYIFNPSYDALQIYSADFNTISLSTVVSQGNAASGHALYILGTSSGNLVTQSRLRSDYYSAARLYNSSLPGARFNTISFSTLTTNSSNSSDGALSFGGRTASNTVSDCYLENTNTSAVSRTVYFNSLNHFNVIAQSTIAARGSAKAVSFDTLAGPPYSMYNVLRQSRIQSQGASAVYFNFSSRNQILQSTITAHVSGASEAAVYLNQATGTVISGSLISNSMGTGVCLYNASRDNIISLSTVTGASDNGSVYLWGSSSNTITDSYVFSPSSHAVRATYNGAAQSTYTHIVNSRLVTMGLSSKYALYLESASSSTVEGSLLSSNGNAVMVNGAANVRIDKSTITAKAGATYGALILASAAQTRVDQSFIANNGMGSGVKIQGVSNFNTISQSTITANSSNDSEAAVYLSGNNVLDNTVATSYVQNTQGHALLMDASVQRSTVTQSFFYGGSGSYAALYFNTAANNLIDQCRILNPASYGYGVRFDYGATSGNVVRLSTITSDSTALQIYNGASGNLITQSYLESRQDFPTLDIAPYGSGYSNYNTVSQSTLIGTPPSSANAAVLNIEQANYNVVQNSFIHNLGRGVAARIKRGSSQGSLQNQVLTSTLTVANDDGFHVESSSASILSGSYVWAPLAAVVVSGSSSTAISASRLFGNDVVKVQAESQDLQITSCALTGFGSVGIILGRGNKGVLAITSNVMTGLYIGVDFYNQPAELRVSSLSFVSPWSAGGWGISYSDSGGVIVSTFLGVGFFADEMTKNLYAPNLGFGSRITMRNAKGPKAGPAFQNANASYVEWVDGNPKASFGATPPVLLASAAPASINGEAFAYDGALVGEVQVAVGRMTDNYWWNSPARLWQASGPVLSTAVFSGGASGTWQWIDQNLFSALSSETTYFFLARATDTLGQVQSADASLVVRFDQNAPAVLVISPAGGESAAGFPQIAGTAQDAFSGIDASSVVVRISSGPGFSGYWNGSAWSMMLSSHPAAFVGDSSGTWVYVSTPPAGMLAPGTQYKVEAWARDRAGNIGPVDVKTFTYEGASVSVNFDFTGNINTGARIASQNAQHEAGRHVFIDKVRAAPFIRRCSCPRPA